MSMNKFFKNFQFHCSFMSKNLLLLNYFLIHLLKEFICASLEVQIIVSNYFYYRFKMLTYIIFYLEDFNVAGRIIVLCNIIKNK